MPGRASLARSEPGWSLPFFDRLAPAPPPAFVEARLEAHTSPGDVVLDLAGRGGWVARAAVDRQRRAVSLETTPLSRLLAELVLRPPDLRHLDAAFQAMGASPHGQTSLKVTVGESFATRCGSCNRALVADEIIWGPAEGDASAPDDDGDGATDGGSEPGPQLPAGDWPGAGHRPTRRHYRCPVCRGQRGGSDQRSEPLDPDDVARALAVPATHGLSRARLRDRFPVVDGADALVDGLLDLHTPRQLAGLEAILERIEGDLRAAPVQAALRLAFLHALLPASRLNGYPGRIGTLRIQAGRVRPPGSGQWRERNPWLALEEGMRIVRGFVQRLESGPSGAVQARLGEDLRSLADGTASVVLKVAGPSAARSLLGGSRDAWDGGVGVGVMAGSSGPATRRPVRLLLGQPPVRPNQERLSLAYWATAWTLGREAASTLPIESLSGPAIRAPWGWQAAALGRSLASVEPVLARDGRAVFLVDGGGPEAIVAAAIGGATAGFRVVGVRLNDGDDDLAGTLELVPPGAILPPGPRTRANVTLDPVPGGAGDPDMVPGSGLFTAPERFDRRPFSPNEAARVVTEIAVETLKARGEPASRERLLGEILVGLDRTGQLRRFVLAGRAETDADDGEAEAGPDGGASAKAPPTADDDAAPPTTGRPVMAVPPSGSGTRVGRLTRPADAPVDQVERLLALVGDELGRSDQRRLAEVEPGRWWLADPRDRAAAAAPLADRVEWAVFSLLSTAGPLSEGAFLERIAALFSGHDLPDETLVRACLESYRSRASTADRLLTHDDLLARAHEHAQLLALLADGGHRLGLGVWIGRREQSRKLGGRRLGDWLDEREQRAYLAHISRAVDDLAEVDCAWYARGKLAFLFEVEWTAMLGEPLLRRHARIPADPSLVRFLVIAPERTDLLRHKLERSPLLREAVERDNWHVLKWNHLRAWLGREDPGLETLEPYLGLDPLVERRGEQLGLFGETPQS